MNKAGPQSRGNPESLTHLASLRMLYRYALRRKGLLVCSFVFLLVSSGCSLLIFSSFGRIVESGFSTESAGAPSIFLFGFAVICLLSIANFIHHTASQVLGEHVVAAIRGDVYSHLLSLAPVHFESNKPAEIASRLTADTMLIHRVVGGTAAEGLKNVITGLGALVIVVAWYPALLLMFLAIALLVTVPIITAGRVVRRLSRTCQDKIAAIGSAATETFSAIQIVQAFTQECEAIRRYKAVVREAFDAAKARTVATSTWDTSVVFLVFTALDIGLWFGAKRVANGALTVGDLATFGGLTFILMHSIMNLSEVYSSLQRAAGGADRITELLATRSALPIAPHPVALPRSAIHDVRFTNVSFAYPSKPGVWALRHFNMCLRPGQTTALVGPSGAGKSTILQLLLRFFDPQEGSILVNQRALKEIDLHTWRSLLSFVPQDTFIFNDSVEANVRFGRADASEKEVRAALSAAQCDEFVQRLPDGVRTNLGEKGVRLSGGQRQRISIARAILRDAPILLLDEATSSLDSEAEELVQRALETLLEGRTTLVIAHRLSTVRKADNIIVLESSEIIDVGTHHDLVRKNGLYARLAKLQFDANYAALT